VFGENLPYVEAIDETKSQFLDTKAEDQGLSLNRLVLY